MSKNVERLIYYHIGYNHDFIKVYPLENLFYNLQNCHYECDEKRSMWTLNVAILELEKDIYEYTPEIGCLVSRSIDGKFCVTHKCMKELFYNMLLVYLQALIY